ncbi:hypothetical protein HDU98_009380 [Podochytrium sp. JEL0797]|nr:hypothetical protein HDU98_009380 [Podochytrium sp. JEL0797]
MIDTRGGFILAEAGEGERGGDDDDQVNVEDHRRPVPNDAVCNECKSIDVCPDLFHYYNVVVCKRCKHAHLDKYSLLTKTECREDYLLTESELRDTNHLPHWMKRNPHSDTYASMLLYLRMHVEQFAIRKWKSLDNLDAEFARRGVSKQARKRVKFEQKMKELRKRTFTSAWMRVQESQGHEHAFGDKEDVGGGLFRQKCGTCGVVMEFEEL